MLLVFFESERTILIDCRTFNHRVYLPLFYLPPPTPFLLFAHLPLPNYIAIIQQKILGNDSKWTTHFFPPPLPICAHSRVLRGTSFEDASTLVLRRDCCGSSSNKITNNSNNTRTFRPPHNKQQPLRSFLNIILICRYILTQSSTTVYVCVDPETIIIIIIIII